MYMFLKKEIVMNDVDQAITHVFLVFFFGGLAVGLLIFATFVVIFCVPLFLFFFLSQKLQKIKVHFYEKLQRKEA